MKKKIAAVAVILSLISIAAMGTMAYFTDSDVAHNVITSGNIDIELIDKTLDDQKVEIDFPEDGFFGVMPSMTKDKIVRVKNKADSQDAWVRVLVHTEISKGNAELPILFDDEPVVIINFLNTDKWEKKAPVTIGTVEYDCWFYNEPLKTGEETPNLFETVTFSGPNMGNEYQGCTVNIDVLAQAVQADNVTVEQLDGLWPTMQEEAKE